MNQEMLGTKLLYLAVIFVLEGSLPYKLCSLSHSQQEHCPMGYFRFRQVATLLTSIMMASTVPHGTYDVNCIKQFDNPCSLRDDHYENNPSKMGNIFLKAVGNYFVLNILFFHNILFRSGLALDSIYCARHFDETVVISSRQKSNQLAKYRTQTLLK